MKRKALKTFRDKHNGNRYLKGKPYEFSEARAKELEEKGFLESGGGESSNSVLDGNAKNVIEDITTDTPSEELADLLEQEKQGSARKTVIQHIEEVMNGESE